MPVDSSGPMRLLHQRIAELPGVEAVGMADNVPLNVLSTSTITLNVDGVPAPEGEYGFDIDKASVDTGFFAAAGYRLLAGGTSPSPMRKARPRW